MIDIEPRMAALRECFGQVRGLVAVYLYGSYGTPLQTPLSDVDLAFVYRLDDPADFEREMDAIGLVLEATNEDDVAVTNLNRAPTPFQFRVLSTGRLIYCSDRVALADFVELVLNRQGDYIVDYEELLREYDSALVARYGYDR